VSEQPNLPDNEPTSRSDPTGDKDAADAAAWGRQPTADQEPTIDAATWGRTPDHSQGQPPDTAQEPPDAAGTRQQERQAAPASGAGQQGPAAPGELAPHDAGTAGLLAGGPVTSGEQMKRRNPLGVWLGLPLITLGIYHFVWYYKIHRELRDFDRRWPVPTVGPVLVLIFLSWTVIGPLISYYRTGVWIAKSQRAAGLPETCVPVFGMLLLLVFGLGTFYFQTELNKVVDRYGGSATQPGTTVPLYA